MRFAKGHGTGNDFVVIADIDALLELTDATVQALCDRHFGIGADGVLRVVRTAAIAEFAHLAEGARWFMDYRNADGSAVEMCGNGIRLFARYLHEAGLASDDAIPVATRAGVKVVTRRSTGVYAVDMGSPVIAEPAPVVLEIDNQKYDVTQVSMGNPHAVLFVDDVAAAPVGTLGPRIETLPQFPAGSNVEFVRVDGPRALTMRVWERGVGETRSCGTGACAAAVAAAYAGHTGRRVEVEVPGGRLEIDWEQGGTVVLTGPAVFVADGEIRADWLAGQRPESYQPESYQPES